MNRDALEYRMPEGDDVVRFVDCSERELKQSLEENAGRIRATKIRGAHVYPSQKALVLRGTVEQLANAERQIQ